MTIFDERSIGWIKDDCAKGDLVHARGRIRNGSYEKDGQTVYTVDLTANEFLVLAKHQPKNGDDAE